MRVGIEQGRRAGRVRVVAGLAAALAFVLAAGPGLATDAGQTPHQAVLERERALPTDPSALQALARDGNADAQNRLALLYINGKGVPKDIAKGVALLRQAAAKNHPVAELNLGILFGAGFGVPKDDAEAVKWYRQAAEQGNPGAQNHLGFAYEHGVGVVQNYAEALAWYRKAADQDEAEAQFNLGIMAERGEGRAADQAEAVRWLRRAAERGYALAQIGLANHYLAGQGAARDAGLAYFWAAIGAAHAPANQSAVAATIRNRATHGLPPDEVMRIQGLAARWQPGVDVATLMPSAAHSSPDSAALPKGATVIVRSTGTGFVVTRSGFALTNAHVVPACTTLTVRAPDGSTHPATVIDRDPRIDLALLKVDHVFTHIAVFREDQPIRQGETVVVYGFPLTGVLADQGNLTEGMVSALAGVGNDSRLIQISAPVQQGNSGGPVVDTSGNIVGVVVSKLNALNMAKTTGDVAQNINFAIKGSVARGFLEANAVSYATAKSARKIDTPDLADRMKDYPVQVRCDK
jgi:TPR repeat protein